MLNQIMAVSFSPTGTTARVVKALADKIGNELALPITEDSFTTPDKRQQRQYDDQTLVIFGVPTYAGRVPNKILPFVQTLFHGKNTPAIAVVTFGNRSYDSSLAELRNELAANGFTIFAAGAFAAPHAFARIGLMHPTTDDKERLDALANAAAKKLQAGTALSTVVINGDAPVAPYYIPCDNGGVPTKFLKAKPKTDLSLCTHCGICARVCPMGSTSREQPEEVTGICIKCQACIQQCPTHAKYFDDDRLLAHKSMLETNYQRPAASEIFY